MAYDSDRQSTRRTYLAHTGALIGITGLGMSALGSASAHDEKDDNDLEKKEPKDENNNKEEKKKENNLFLTHFAKLNGKNEVPSVKTDAMGAAGFVVDKCDKKLRFIIHVKDLCDITAAHIHLGEKGENGPVVVGYQLKEETMDGRFDEMLAQGVVKKEDFAEDLNDLEFKKFCKKLDNKGLYVNVHTKKNSEGEIRGQIRCAEKDDMKKDGDNDGGPPGGTT